MTDASQLAPALWKFLKANIGVPVAASDAAAATGIALDECASWLTGSDGSLGLAKQADGIMYVYRPPRPEAIPLGPVFQQVGQPLTSGVRIVEGDDGKLYPLGLPLSGPALVAMEMPGETDVAGTFRQVMGRRARAVTGMSLGQVRGLAQAEGIPSDAEFYPTKIMSRSEAGVELRWGGA